MRPEEYISGIYAGASGKIIMFADRGFSCFRVFMEKKICMMEKWFQIKRKLWNVLWKGCSMTTMMFVFQACYGTFEDYGMDVYIEGVVKCKDTRQPMAGVKVVVRDSFQYTVTNEQGEYGLYVTADTAYRVSFEVDGEAGIRQRDTVVRSREEKIVLNMFLEQGCLDE